MKIIIKKSIFHTYGLPVAMAVLIGLSNCNYQQRVHSNTSCENAERPVKTDGDTFAHAGNGDKDIIYVEK